LFDISVNEKFRITAKIILFLLPILGIFGLLFPIFFHQNALAILGIYLAIPMIISPIIFVYLNKKNIKYGIQEIKIKYLYEIFLSGYLVLWSISLIVLYSLSVRPVVYYALVSLMSFCILSEILFFDITEGKVRVLLLQIGLLLLNIIWGVTLKYPYFIGRTDPPAHVWFIENIVNSGHITNILSMYKPFPLWHILNAYAIFLSGLLSDFQYVMFFLNGLIYFFIAIFIYLISKKLFANDKFALIAALFTIFNPDILIYGMSSISRSVVSFLLVLLLFLLFKYSNKMNLILILIVSISLILYHTASIPFIITILLILFLLQNLYSDNKDKSYPPAVYIGLLGSLTIVYWIYNAHDLLALLIENAELRTQSNNFLIIGQDQEIAQGVLSEAIFSFPQNELINYLQYLPLLIFIFIGILCVINSQNTTSLVKIFCLCGLIMIPLALPGPIFLFEKFTFLNINRFGEYGFLFFSLAASFGLLYLFSKAHTYQKYFVIILFVSMAFLSISNDFTASDNPLIKRPFYTFYISEDELSGIDKMTEVSKGYVLSDYIVTRFLKFSKYNSKAHILEVDSREENLLKGSEDDVILIREHELQRRPLKLYSSPDLFFQENPSWLSNLNYYSDQNFQWRNIENFNKIYDNKALYSIK
jgi:hypothetical protein